MPIDGGTELYGIMGWPVAHSLSPAMHNAAFTALGMNRVYLPFPVQDVESAVRGIRALGVRGVSVTVPHKQAVLPLLDRVEPVAARIGAVNTIVVEEEGKLAGYNTDWLGANRALTEVVPVKGKRAVLLGAGGAARAIGFGLLEAGVAVTVVNRTPATGEALAADLGCAFCSLADIDRLTADILINATSVGMGEDRSPVAASWLAGVETVMDIVYAPLQTRLLRDAAGEGCRCINGLAMLLYQGVAQFELWTGAVAPVTVMKDVLYRATGN